MRAAFWGGFLAAIGMATAFQDFLGLDAYIEWCQRYWITLPPIVGLAVAGCGFVLYKLAETREQGE